MFPDRENSGQPGVNILKIELKLCYKTQKVLFLTLKRVFEVGSGLGVQRAVSPLLQSGL